MTAETAREFARLEAQAQRLMAVFARAGFEPVAPAIIQPAGVFLDAVGEALRARTYVFTDPDGQELCLRPDLTVPTCRLHLERSPDPATPARYCYNGAAFRYQSSGTDATHPREFRQAGVEIFGADGDPANAEAETLDLIVRALAEAGIDRRALTMQFGDLGLIGALLDALDLPPLWRARLKVRFCRPVAFRAELARLADGAAGSKPPVPASLLKAVDGLTGGKLAAEVGAHIDAHGLEVFGSRTIADVAEGLSAWIEDRRAKPLSTATAELINGYIAINAPCREAADRIAALAKSAHLDLDQPLAAFTRRLDAFAKRGIDLDHATYSGAFGRQLAYYTGFVFEIVSPALGPTSPLAGGGRYDGLMRISGSPVDVPAVGAAIHTERLLVASGVAQVRTVSMGRRT